MENFTFLNPTKIIFGRDTEETVGAETARFTARFCCISVAARSRPPASTTASAPR